VRLAAVDTKMIKPWTASALTTWAISTSTPLIRLPHDHASNAFKSRHPKRCCYTQELDLLLATLILPYDISQGFNDSYQHSFCRKSHFLDRACISVRRLSVHFKALPSLSSPTLLLPASENSAHHPDTAPSGPTNTAPSSSTPHHPPRSSHR
jgi:hypothetical protein